MRLLIISLDAYSLFDTTTHFIFGGAELRSFLFSNELSGIPGVEVTVVTRDHARAAKKSGNVLVVPHPLKKGEGYWEKQKKISTRIKNRLIGTTKKKDDQQESRRFFKSLAPTHMMILGMSKEAVEALEYCSVEGIPLIFGCATDFDLSEKYLDKNSPVDSSGNDASRYAEVLRHASLVLVQSKQQEMMLESRFGRKGVIIANPVSSVPPTGISPVTSTSDVLWVGKTSPLKRPEIFFELAKALPNFRFRMIMNLSDKRVWEKLVSKKPANLEVIESVPASLIEFYFMKTRIFVNTSIVEGFANTFLQAGKYGIPVVSMNADPNHIFSEGKSGILSGDSLVALKDSVEQLLNNTLTYNTCSKNIREYVQSNHDIKKVGAQLHDAIKQTHVNAV